MFACIPTGQPGAQEAAAAGRRHGHVPGFQIRGDVSARDLRLRLRDGPGLHHRSDPGDGDENPAGAEVQAGPPSAPAVSATSLKDL